MTIMEIMEIDFFYLKQLLWYRAIQYSRVIYFMLCWMFGLFFF